MRKGRTRSGVSNLAKAIPDVPDAPTIGAVSDPGTDGYASVAFTAATTGGAVTTYTATSTPGTLTGTSATSPISVTGLTLSTAYTFKVKGANSTATGPESSASSTFTPAFHPIGSYDSIATYTTTSTDTSVVFSSIPSTYTHLQIRVSARAGIDDDLRFRLNGDTGGNYSRHLIYGNGTAVGTGSGLSSSVGSIGAINNTANVFSVGVLDILDYTNTNKYTTSRSLNGYDANGSGYAMLYSTAWMNTAAVTSITVFPQSSSFQQYSSIALYGIKGA